VIGFEERDGTFEPAAGRPTNLDAWSQDSIQSIVFKYADPGVQCRVHHRASAASRERYPIIAVPGGHRVPIRAKAGSPDGKKLSAHRVYIRRPGPASEEPKTAEEWDRFFERCLQNGQAELLEAMRSIMTGVIPDAAPAIPTRFDELKAFETKAIARWKTLLRRSPGEITAIAGAMLAGRLIVPSALAAKSKKKDSEKQAAITPTGRSDAGARRTRSFAFDLRGWHAEIRIKRGF
jgi:hypothetical protein